MLKVGINQNSLKVRPKDLFPIREGNMFFLTKIILVAVLLSGLICLSSTSSANAATNYVITGDTQKYRIFEGQTPTMQPSDAAMATNPMPGTFEW